MQENIESHIEMRQHCLAVLSASQMLTALFITVTVVFAVLLPMAGL